MSQFDNILSHLKIKGIIADPSQPDATSNFGSETIPESKSLYRQIPGSPISNYSFK